jgi:amidophosphoribosyltransferase
MPKTVHLPVLQTLQGQATSASDSAFRPLDPDLSAYEKKEKCGVFGVWGIPNAARMTYLGLYAQQHRGQESAGIVVSNGAVLSGVTGMGLVPEIFDTATIEQLDAKGPNAGNLAGGAIGHNRYSTAGGSLACNAQPLLENYIGGQVSVAHNGNLINADKLRLRFEELGHLFHTTSDTEVVVHLLASPQQQRSPDPLAATLRHLQGAFSLLFLFPDRLEAARDPWGWRPLTLGVLPASATNGNKPRYVVASETVALDVVGAKVVRDVEPGEIITITDDGYTSRRFAEPSTPLAQCVFEHVYFANPSSVVFGQNVQIARESMGERLALESPVQADYVVPMPDSGRSAALGFSRASGIQYREAIVPNRYVGRTFIKPTQDQRQAAVRLKLNVIDELVRGKRLVIVDDSIVRGTTTKAKMDQLRAAGAKEIHLRISCPPIRHPCYFGVDFADRSQLVATGRTIEDIRTFLGVDSLAYLSLDGLLGLMKHGAANYCSGCYSGEYRLDINNPVTEEADVASQLKMFS